MGLTNPVIAGGKLLRFGSALSGPVNNFEISQPPPPPSPVPGTTDPDPNVPGNIQSPTYPVPVGAGGPLADPALHEVVPGTYGLQGEGSPPTTTPTWNGKMPGYTITPHDDPQTIVNRAAEGAIIAIAPGIHDQWHRVKPKSNQKFLAYAGAVLRGSTVLENWTRISGYARHSGIKAWNKGAYPHNPKYDFSWRNQTYDFSKNSWRAEVLYFYLFDGRIIYGNHVNAKANIKDDYDYWIDYNAGHVWIKNSSVANEIRISRRENAIVIPAGTTGVRIRGFSAEWMLDVREFACTWHEGAIEAKADCHDTLYQHIHARINHGVGLVISGSRSVVEECDVIENGQMGIRVSRATNGKILRCRLIRNNPRERLGIRGWETGGLKFSRGSNQEIAYNYGTGNSQNFIWADVDPYKFNVHHNFCEFNDGRGGFHEHTKGGTWQQNYFRQNCQWFVYKSGSRIAYTGQPAEFLVWEAASAGDRAIFKNNVIEVAELPTTIGPAAISVFETVRKKPTGWVDTWDNRIIFMGPYNSKTMPRTGTFSGDKKAPINHIRNMGATCTFKRNEYHVLDRSKPYFWEAYGHMKHHMRNFAAAQARGWEQGSRMVEHTSVNTMPLIDRSKLRLDERGCPAWTDIFKEATVN